MNVKVFNSNEVYKIMSLSQGDSVCDHCGHKIKNIFVIQDSSLNNYNVGSKCVEKIDGSLTTIAEQKLKILKSSLKREQKLLRFKEIEYKKKVNFQKSMNSSISGEFLIQIVDEDVSEFSQFLLVNGCERTEDPEIFNAMTLDNLNSLIPTEGILKFEHTSGIKNLIDYLLNYTGSFDFIQSLKNQYVNKGYLTKNQLESLSKIVESEKIKKDVPVIILDDDAQIRVSKFMAKSLGNKAGLSKAHYIFKVFEIHQETEKAYKLRLQASGKPTTHCSCCGTKLSNEISVKLGIGPVCAEKMGVSDYIELCEKLDKTVVFESWVPKRSIKEKVGF